VRRLIPPWVPAFAGMTKVEMAANHPKAALPSQPA